MPSPYRRVASEEDDQEMGIRKGRWSIGLSARRRWMILGLAVFIMTGLWAFSGRDLRRYNTFPAGEEVDTLAVQPSKRDVTLLVASMKKDDTAWLKDYRPEWEKKIYVTDDQSAPLTVPMNKGREAMVYLTYIIDHYDSLAPVTIFHHATRYQWHNDDPLYDGQRMLDRLQTKHILETGYVNLRCVWTLGCPAEIHPIDQESNKPANDDDTGSYYAEAFRHLFPDRAVPTAIGASCCAQFAASRDTIRRRPVSDYEHFRDWIINTELKDHISGRILEYSWHMIFGQDSVYCPDAKTCYCKVYGLCHLTCSEGTCESQYTLPPYSTLPQGWPEVGWKGEVRNITKMRAEQALDYDPE